MAAVYDILVDDNFDLGIEDGDLLTGESTTQHINHILIANKGDYRAFPTLGADINRVLNEEMSKNELKADVQENLESDKLTIFKIEIDNDFVNIIAEYK